VASSDDSWAAPTPDTEPSHGLPVFDSDIRHRLRDDLELFTKRDPLGGPPADTSGILQRARSGPISVPVITSPRILQILSKTA